MQYLNVTEHEQKAAHETEEENETISLKESTRRKPLLWSLTKHSSQYLFRARLQRTFICGGTWLSRVFSSAQNLYFFSFFRFFIIILIITSESFLVGLQEIKNDYIIYLVPNRFAWNVKSFPREFSYSVPPFFLASATKPVFVYKCYSSSFFVFEKVSCRVFVCTFGKTGLDYPKNLNPLEHQCPLRLYFFLKTPTQKVLSLF